MARFANTAPKTGTAKAVVKKGAKIKNFEGVKAYSVGAQEELIGILMTSMVADQFYRTAGDTNARLKELIAQVDPLFVAKALVWARNQAGMRSITHIGTVELLRRTKGEEWAKNFVEAVVRRPDDMIEILAYQLATYGKPIPNALKKGFNKAFGKFDEYQLAKYRGEGKGVSLVDVVNLVHVVPTEKNAAALKALVNNELRARDTHQVELSKAGQTAKTVEEKEAVKAEAWRKRLMSENAEGYFAVLRNLRNILATGEKDLIQKAQEMLLNEKALKRSLVMPYRFLSAYEMVTDRSVRATLSKALDLSVANVPELGGSTLVAVDHSGSMGSGLGSAKFKGDVLAAIMAKKTDGDIMIFGTDAGYVEDYAASGVLDIASEISRIDYGYGTNMNQVFKTARKAYDRVILVTDQQSWIGERYYDEGVRKALDAYKKKFNVDPHVYVLDLSGYGTTPFKKKDKVVQIPGFNDKGLEFIKANEADTAAFINEISSVDFVDYAVKVEA